MVSVQTASVIYFALMSFQGAERCVCNREYFYQITAFTNLHPNITATDDSQKSIKSGYVYNEIVFLRI